MKAALEVVLGTRVTPAAKLVAHPVEKAIAAAKLVAHPAEKATAAAKLVAHLVEKATAGLQMRLGSNPFRAGSVRLQSQLLPIQARRFGSWSQTEQVLPAPDSGPFWRQSCESQRK